MAKNNLVLMDAGMFCEGMHINAKIYYQYKGAYVLLCKNAFFTKALTEKLHHVAEETGGVYIEEESYEEVWNESLLRYSMDSNAYLQSYQQVRQDYDQVINRTVDFLQQVSQEGGVPLPISERISEDIAESLRTTSQDLILRCINMIGDADNYLYTHSVNVASLNGLIGRWMKLSEGEIQQLIQVGLLHDLGKLKIPATVLHKPGALTQEEFAVIKQHPLHSYEMLRQSGEQNILILQAVRHHHEKPNATGYPDGIPLEDISLFARITAVSDVYDAMVSKRCYKDANSPFEILSQFKANRFSDLDHEIIDIFLDNITFLFIGMTAKLSNGDCGEIIFVPPTNLANPVVKVGQHIFATNEDCKCLALLDD